MLDARVTLEFSRKVEYLIGETEVKDKLPILALPILALYDDKSYSH
jgi:hypothetical protein